MDQTIIENGNNVENYVYKNRVANSVECFKSQMTKKFATNGKIIGKGDYEFCVVGGKLVQVVPQNLHKPLKRIMKTLESEGIISSDHVEELQNSTEETLVAEVATM